MYRIVQYVNNKQTWRLSNSPNSKKYILGVFVFSFGLIQSVSRDTCISKTYSYAGT